MNRFFFYIATVALLAACPLRAGTFQWQPSLRSGRVAAFTLWTPEDALTLSAVIAVIPGFMGDSRASTADPDWQRLATKWHCALLGCQLQNDGYWVAGGWSGATLLLSLNEFGRQSGHPELANARLAFWGHSAGGQFSASFVDWQPNRVITFVANRGSFDCNPNGLSHRVPALWIAGEKDREDTNADLTNIFTAGRRLGAPWAFALEPNVGHEIVGSKTLGIAYIDAVFRSGDPDNVFHASHPAFPKAWIGDLRTHEIGAANQTQPGSQLNAWLPDEQFARQWAAFVQRRDAASSPAP
jgi:hypothetical protein